MVKPTGPTAIVGPGGPYTLDQASGTFVFRGDGFRHGGISFFPNTSAALARMELSIGFAFDPSLNAPGITLVQNGRVGIGTDAPAFDLDVNGSAGKPGGGSWSVSSDARLKKNVADLENGLETLLSLRGVTFEYKDPAAITSWPASASALSPKRLSTCFPTGSRKWTATSA